MSLTDGPLTLTVITPTGTAAESHCDSVTLPAADGGSMGVRRGHAQALVALSAGTVRASAGGKPLLAVRIEGGMASVLHDAVTVVCDSAEVL